MSLHHDRGNFWTKVRSSTNKISSSLANLSIRSEHDGDSPNSTLIHKALVNHYVSKNEQFPQWLGEEQENHQHHNHPQRAQPQSTAQEQNRQPVQTQRFQPQPQQQQQSQPQQGTPGTSRFASRFANDQNTRSPSRFATSGADHGSNGGSRFAGSNTRPGHPERSDSSSGSAMKDRLKRNNYRNNFGV